MKPICSAYVRALEPTGEPTAAAFDELWTELRRLLRRELRRRGLWERPPSHLGMVGHPAWTAPGAGPVRGAPKRTRDALDELTAEGYVEIFVQRLRSLRRYVEAGSDIDGVVVRGVRQMLHERQKRHDPLGFRLYRWLRAALERAVESRALEISEGGPEIHNGTVFALCPTAEPEAGIAAAGDETLSQEVRRWNDELLLPWITARGGQTEALVARLESRLRSLAAAGVGSFTFKALADAMKRDVRGRLAALWAGRDPTSAVDEGAVWEDPLSRVVEQDRLRRLSECVEEGLEHLPAQRRARDQLRQLWRFLEAFALTAADSASAPEEDALASALQGEALPSHRELSRLLGIRHDRFPALFARLKGEVRRCLEEESSRNAATLEPGSEAELGDSQNLGQELRRATAEAFRRDIEASPPAPGAPRPGDLHTLPACPEPALEWLVLELEAAKAELLVVPADTVSAIGTADAAAADAAAAGPLSLRCGHGLWLSEQKLRRQPGGRIAAADLERARQHRSQWLAGDVVATASQREVDLDPDYRRWCRTLEDARRAVCTELEGRLDGASDRPGAEVVELRPKPIVPIPRRAWAVAASIAVALTSGLVAGRLWEQRRVDPRIIDLEAGQRRLEAARDDLARDLETDRARFEEERERTAAGYRQEMAAQQQRFEDELARVDEPEAAVPWIVAPIDLQRSERLRLLVPRGARSIVLLLEAAEGDRVEIRILGGEVIWSADIGPTDTSKEAMVRLPARLMPSGDYEVTVLRQDREESEFLLQVEPQRPEPK